MVSLEGWQLILTIISTLTVGGVISSVISLWWSKRTNEANTKKLEEEVEQEAAKSDQERENADSLAIANAKEVIQMYKESVEQLTELYNKTTKELNDRCSRLESEFTTYRQNAQKRMTDFERQVIELQASLKVQCNDCAFSKDCKKRIALGIKFKKSSKDPLKQ
jgi:inorganic triphosphatase YgiF